MTIEPAGQTLLLFSRALEGVVSGGQVNNLRSRLGTYFKGSRLYKVDQVVANGTVPTPQLVSSLASTDVCGDNGIADSSAFGLGNNFANLQRGWVFLRGPGADAQCGTADDRHRAVRLDMAATDAALTIAEPQVDIFAADGGHAGLIVREGNRIQRLDAGLGNPVNLFTINTAGYTNLGLSFGTAAPGFWLFIEGGKLWGVNLAAPTTRVELATLAAGESSSPTFASDGGSAFVGLSTSAGARVLRITESLATTTVATLAEPLSQLGISPTRLVMLTQATAANLLSVAKTGGATTLLNSYATGVIVGQMLVSGENVYAVQYQFGATGSSVSTLIIGTDGGNRTTLANTDIKRGVAASTQSLVSGLNNTYAVLLADGSSGLTSNAGATLRAVEGATRNTLVTYGSLPSSPDGVAYIATVDPLQYGQSGLFSFIPTATGTPGFGDLYYFKSDAAGLIRVTNFGTAAPSQATRAQTQAVRDVLNKTAAVPANRATQGVKSSLLAR